MVSSKKLLQMAKRWMKAAGVSRKQIASSEDAAVGEGSIGVPAVKGHFAVYTNDGKRFVIPLKWLTSDIFGELLKMAEEEFGLRGNRPITLPCDGPFMEEVVKLMRRRSSRGLEEALLSSLASSRCSASFSGDLSLPKQLHQLAC